MTIASGHGHASNIFCHPGQASNSEREPGSRAPANYATNFAPTSIQARKALNLSVVIVSFDMANKMTIYMPLLDEGTDVWRPVEAVREGDGYLVLGPMPSEETWKFAPGTVVRCEFRVFSDGTRDLVAVDISN
jgi:hypothetical protein